MPSTVRALNQLSSCTNHGSLCMLFDVLAYSVGLLEPDLAYVAKEREWHTKRRDQSLEWSNKKGNVEEFPPP